MWSRSSKKANCWIFFNQSLRTYVGLYQRRHWSVKLSLHRNTPVLLESITFCLLTCNQFTQGNEPPEIRRQGGDLQYITDVYLLFFVLLRLFICFCFSKDLVAKTLNFVNRCQSTTLNTGLQDSCFFNRSSTEDSTLVIYFILLWKNRTSCFRCLVFIKVHFSFCLLATEILRLMLGASKKTPELNSRYNLDWI